MKRVALWIAGVVAVAAAASALAWAAHLAGRVRALERAARVERKQRLAQVQELKRGTESLRGEAAARLQALEAGVEQAMAAADVESRLPADYVEAVRALVRDRIRELAGQEPVFGPAWEVREIRFLAPNLVSVRCRDGAVQGTLLVWIYPGDEEPYAAEVLFSDLRPWAG